MSNYSRRARLISKKIQSENPVSLILLNVTWGSSRVYNDSDRMLCYNNSSATNIAFDRKHSPKIASMIGEFIGEYCVTNILISLLVAFPDGIRLIMLSEYSNNKHTVQFNWFYNLICSRIKLISRHSVCTNYGCWVHKLTWLFLFYSKMIGDRLVRKNNDNWRF